LLHLFITPHIWNLKDEKLTRLIAVGSAGCTTSPLGNNSSDCLRMDNMDVAGHFALTEVDEYQFWLCIES